MQVHLRTMVLNGEHLTPWEFVCYVLGHYIAQPLRTFTRRARITPEMRERCVRYAIDGGARGAWNIAEEAGRIAKYIAGVEQ